jgi:hypothetical protein
VGSDLIVRNLSAALLQEGSDELGADVSRQYALRAVQAMRKLAVIRNSIVDLSVAMPGLIQVTEQNQDTQMQTLAAEVLAFLSSPDAQRAIAAMALSEQNSNDIRVAAFHSLALSAKMNANLLLTEQVEAIYKLVSAFEIDPQLRAAAAGAYGALNLPSEQVKKLILDQAKS